MVLKNEEKAKAKTFIHEFVISAVLQITISSNVGTGKSINQVSLLLLLQQARFYN